MNPIFEKNPTINIEQAKQKGFITNNILKEIYFDYQKKYYKILENYLIKNLKLDEAEKLLSSNDSKTKHFFIKNNLNIENLTIEELKTLKNESNLSNLIELIEQTLQSVININYYNGKRIAKGKILIDGTSEEHLKNTDSLILGFSYNIFNNNISDEQWEDYFVNQNIIVEDLLNNIKKNATNNLKCPIEFIKYF